MVRKIKGKDNISRIIGEKTAYEENEKIKNDSEQILEFLCLECGKVYEYKVGKVSINTETEEEKFENEPICPYCLTKKSWDLNFGSQIIVNNIFYSEMKKKQTGAKDVINEGMKEDYSFGKESYSRFYPRVKEKDVVDKYITKHRYVGEFGYPIKGSDYLNIELINLAGRIIEEYGVVTRKELEAILIKVAKELREIEEEIIKILEEEKKITGKKEIEIDIELEKEEAGKYFSKFKEYGIRIDLLPENLRKETPLNHWYISMANEHIIVIQREIEKITGKKEATGEISFGVYMKVLEYISDNCYGKCNHKCIREINEISYCRVCQMGEDRLQCPKYGEISYAKIKALESDMDEHK